MTAVSGNQRNRMIRLQEEQEAGRLKIWTPYSYFGYSEALVASFQLSVLKDDAGKRLVS